MNQIPQMKRVDSVDALRGFAVVAIMLLHFVEHFIYGVYPEATSKTAELLNQSVWNALFFIFAGKSYTVFALLFGFTFIVQQRNQEAKGGDFGGRFVWRLVILMFFATLNAAFFPGGDVLLLFAIMGFVMIPLRKLSQRNLLLIASLFLIQPIELLECFGIDFIPTLLNDTYYPTLKTVIDSGNFWDMIVANAGIGQLASLFWAVDTGRLLQAPGLFILGMILARGDYFSCGAGFWVKTFVGSFIASFLFYVAKTSAVDALHYTFQTGPCCGHVFSGDAKGDVLGPFDAVVAFGNLVFQHPRVFCADAVEAVIRLGDIHLVAAPGTAAAVDKGKLKRQRTIKIIQPRAPTAENGRLILGGRNGIVDVLIFQRFCVNTSGELTNAVRQHPHIGNGLLGRYGRRTITGPRQAF